MKVDLAWAAGFFDGEGWVGAVQSTKTSEGIRSLVGQNDQEVLLKFQRATGLGRIRGPYKGRKNPHFFWSVTSEKDVKALFTLLQPYLGSIKTKQFEAAIHKYDNRTNKRRSY